LFSLDVNEAARLLRKSIIYIEADDVYLEQDEEDLKEEVDIYIQNHFIHF
jgi:hypothetical protein